MEPWLKSQPKGNAFSLLYSSSTQILSPCVWLPAPCLTHLCIHACNKIYRIPSAQMALLPHTTQTSEIYCDSPTTPNEGGENSPHDQCYYQTRGTLTLGAAESWWQWDWSIPSGVAGLSLQSFLFSCLLWVFRFLARQCGLMCSTLDRKWGRHTSWPDRTVCLSCHRASLFCFVS